jgi:cell division inhibitor SulA
MHAQGCAHCKDWHLTLRKPLGTNTTSATTVIAATTVTAATTVAIVTSTSFSNIDEAITEVLSLLLPLLLQQQQQQYTTERLLCCAVLHNCIELLPNSTQ